MTVKPHGDARPDNRAAVPPDSLLSDPLAETPQAPLLSVGSTAQTLPPDRTRQPRPLGPPPPSAPPPPVLTTMEALLNTAEAPQIGPAGGPPAGLRGQPEGEPEAAELPVAASAATAPGPASETEAEAEAPGSAKPAAAPSPKDGTKGALSPTGASHALGGTNLVGTIINGRYEVLARLGKGGMGVVYKARHLVLDSLVAIKILLKSQNREDQRRFILEARLASRVAHPNTVYVSDFGVLGDGRSYLVMEFLRGQTLGAVMMQGRLDPLRACRIAVQIARGLQAIHDKGIVHRGRKSARSSSRKGATRRRGNRPGKPGGTGARSLPDRRCCALIRPAGRDCHRRFGV